MSDNIVVVITPQVNNTIIVQPQTPSVIQISTNRSIDWIYFKTKQEMDATPGKAFAIACALDYPDAHWAWSTLENQWVFVF